MFLQVKLGGRISRPTVVNDDFQVVSGIHKLEPVVVPASSWLHVHANQQVLYHQYAYKPFTHTNDPYEFGGSFFESCQHQYLEPQTTI